MNQEEVIKKLKYRRSKYLENSQPTNSHNYFKNLITRSLLSIIVLLLGIIMLKGNKDLLVDKVFTKNISFAKISTFYNKYFGSLVPKLPLNNPTETVFKEELTYQSKDDYLNGVKLTVEDNYLVPVLKSGIIVFTGSKEGYENTIIIQGTDGTDIWYGNIKNSDYKLYDYVKEGSLLGETKDNTLYLVFQKEDKFLKFDEYLTQD